jgi:cyclophilin family peptidyl-prolyl cis-trans isomerase
MDSRYTIFGKVVGGADILDELRAGDKIENLTVYIREGGR